MNEHKDQFHQEESRSIAYVVFDASPNAADSAALRQQLADMKADFTKSDKPEAFLARMGFFFGGGSRDDDREGGAWGGLLMLILAPFAAMLIQMAISRSREYDAALKGAREERPPRTPHIRWDALSCRF